MKPTIWTAALALAAASLAMASEAKEKFHYDYKLASGAHVRVATMNGGISIEGWDKEAIQIDGEKRARTEADLPQVKIEIQAEANSITIRTETPRDSHINGGASYRLMVPRKVMLDEIAASNGPVSVSGIEGEAKLSTSNGPVAVEQFSGRLTASTSNGPLRVRLQKPDSGSVLDLSTSNGPVEVALGASPIPELRVATSNAPITVRLPDSVGARLKAATSNGSITSDFEMTVAPGWRSGNSLDATLGGGGKTLDLRTSNGPIRILRSGAQAAVTSRFRPGRME